MRTLPLGDAPWLVRARRLVREEMKRGQRLGRREGGHPTGSCFLECFAFSDKFNQGVNACLRNEEYCKLVVWCSFVDYVPILLVRLVFKNNVLVRLYFHSAWAVGGFLYVMGLVVFAGVSMSGSDLCYYSIVATWQQLLLVRPLATFATVVP
jgi:hypothetical protein